MKVCDFIGIIVLECEKCGKKYVVDSTAPLFGFSAGGCCVGDGFYSSFAQLDMKLINVFDNRDIGTGREAMPIAEYKKLLADFIITGKKPKIQRKHSKVVSFDTDESQYQSLYESLRQLGFKKDEAFAKIDVALKEGLRMETEIIKYILSLE